MITVYNKDLVQADARDLVPLQCVCKRMMGNAGSFARHIKACVVYKQSGLPIHLVTDDTHLQVHKTPNRPSGSTSNSTLTGEGTMAESHASAPSTAGDTASHARSLGKRAARHEGSQSSSLGAADADLVKKLKSALEHRKPDLQALEREDFNKKHAEVFSEIDLSGVNDERLVVYAADACTRFAHKHTMRCSCADKNEPTLAQLLEHKK